MACAVAVLLAAAEPAHMGARASTSDVPATSEVVQSIETRLTEARANLALAEAPAEAALTNFTTGSSLDDITARRALLSRLVRLLEQQLSSSTELETIKTRRADLARKAQSWTRFPESPPYSIPLADRLREEMLAEQLKNTSGEAAISAIDQLIEENRNQLAQTEGRLRQFTERLEAGGDPSSAARTARADEQYIQQPLDPRGNRWWIPLDRAGAGKQDKDQREYSHEEHQPNSRR